MPRAKWRLPQGQAGLEARASCPLWWPALGVPSPGRVQRGAVLTVGRERSGCCRAHLEPGTLGDLAGGPGRRGQQLLLMSQGHE